jgi:hypothetical protein
MQARTPSAGIEPIALGARSFFILETKKRSISDYRLGGGPKDALGAAVGPNHEEMCVVVHVEIPLRMQSPTKRSASAPVPRAKICDCRQPRAGPFPLR